MKTEKIDQSNLALAADLLRRGEVVAFPTETVYGLGASIFSTEAIQKIFDVKGRPSDNPLIAHISDLEALDQIAKDIPQEFYKLAKHFFPGPLTVVLPKTSNVPSIASAGLATIAVRMPGDPIALELIRLVGSPLVAPSANLSGRPSATQVSHVLDDFDGKIAGVVLGDACSIGIESTVVQIVSGKVEILRPGAIKQEEIEACLEQKVSLFVPTKDDSQALPSPGMKYRHYAPLARVTLFYSKQEAILNPKALILSNHQDLPGTVLPLQTSSFYSSLRFADEKGYEEVIIVCDPKTLRDQGLMNRIEKASGL